MLKKCQAENVQVYLQPFRCNSLLKCVSQPKIAEKFTKKPYFEGSGSLKVIDVDSNKKLATSACYDKQHVCAYLQPYYARQANSGKITTCRFVKMYVLC